MRSSRPHPVVLLASAAAGYLSVVAAVISHVLLHSQALMGPIPILAVALISPAWGTLPALVCAAVGGMGLAITIGGGNITDGLRQLPIYLLVCAVLAVMGGRERVGRERLRRSFAALEETAMKLEEEQKKSGIFFSVASHELRTPITSIIMGLQMIEHMIGRTDPAHRPPGYDRLLRLTAISVSNAKRLGALEDALLSYSKISTGKLAMERRPQTMEDLLGDVVERKRALWSERAIRLSLHGDRRATVEADHLRIGQVLTNYMTNALKYSPPGSPIVVRARMGERGFYCSVRDFGSGLAPGEEEKIWEIYSGSGHTRDFAQGGGNMGLGLYITKNIVVEHGGSYGVKSTPCGCTFYFTLPRAGTEREEGD